MEGRGFKSHLGLDISELVFSMYLHLISCFSYNDIVNLFYCEIWFLNPLFNLLLEQELDFVSNKTLEEIFTCAASSITLITTKTSTHV